MRLRFARGKDGSPNVLTCFRDDGTAAWMPLDDFFPLHDLTHYAVERTLGYHDAFFGLIARGWDIRDFTDKARDPVTGGVVKSVLPPEAVWTEYIVGTLDAIRALIHSGAVEPDTTETLFYEMIAANRNALDIPLPEVAPQRLHAILHLRDELAGQWQRLAPGEYLEREF